MRLLCLALLCAAGTGCPGGSRAPGPGSRAGGAREAAGDPGIAAPLAVDPRQAWMLLAGTPGRGKPGTKRGGTRAPGTEPGGTRAPGPVPSQSARKSARTAVQIGLEELLRELQGMVKEQVKMCRKAWEGREEEEERGEGNPQAGPHCRVEAAFHCQTRENISVEQRARQELQRYYIPEAREMFHRGPGLNLTSGQYTAPVAGYYAFSTTLRIARREQRRKGQLGRGNHLRVLICVQSRCHHNSNLETVSQLESSGDLFTVSVTGILYLQAGQYASVFLDNAADSPLTIQSGSDFSAILLGV